MENEWMPYSQMPPMNTPLEVAVYDPDSGKETLFDAIMKGPMATMRCLKTDANLNGCIITAWRTASTGKGDK